MVQAASLAVLRPCTASLAALLRIVVGCKTSIMGTIAVASLGYYPWHFKC